MVKQSIECTIYKTPKRQGAYLYISASTLPDALPESLQQLFSDRVEVLQLTLTATTLLASEDTLQVLANLQRDGFHLQLERSPTADLLEAMKNQRQSSG